MTTKTTLYVRTFWRYQHYHDRTPPWIKLHAELLVDDELRGLPAPTRLAAILLLLVASKRENRIPRNEVWLSEEIGIPLPALRKALAQLLEIGFLTTSADEIEPRQAASNGASARASSTASTVASTDASPRARPRGRERKREKETPPGSPPSIPPDRDRPAAQARGAGTAADHHRDSQGRTIPHDWTRACPPWKQIEHLGQPAYAIDAYGSPHPPLISQHQPPWPPEGA